MNKVEVRIMGQGYLLSCSEDGEERLRDAVARVDAAMCKIRDAGKIKARDRIAVLAALNLAFELSQPSPPQAAGRRAAANASAIAPAEAGNPDQPALAALLARLDEALMGADGQLL
ncbi:MAG: cell division protein ZapA [Burkholderiaceae bacterium]|jgi:cell division protein ZapA|nr:cell division protein ZapA [Burkholderiaceae bacterium]